MKKIFAIYFLLSFYFSFAEKLSNYGADVKNVERTQTLYRLEPSTEVDFTAINSTTVKILAIVFVDTIAITDEGEILSNTFLYDSVGKRVGKIYEKFRLERFYKRSGDHIRCELFGIIPAYCIEKSSIIENDLQTILLKKKQIVFDDFEKHFNKFNYTNWEGTGEFTSKYFPEAAVNTMHPGGRIVLIFIQDELAGIVYSRELKVTFFESKAESTPYKIYYMKKMSNEEKQKLAGFYFEKVRSR